MGADGFRMATVVIFKMTAGDAGITSALSWIAPEWLCLGKNRPQVVQDKLHSWFVQINKSMGTGCVDTEN